MNSRMRCACLLYTSVGGGAGVVAAGAVDQDVAGAQVLLHLVSHSVAHVLDVYKRQTPGRANSTGNCLTLLTTRHRPCAEHKSRRVPFARFERKKTYGKENLLHHHALSLIHI